MRKWNPYTDECGNEYLEALDPKHFVIDGDGNYVCYLTPMYDEIDKANLIAAAPDMFEALERVVKGDFLSNSDKRIVRSAIARAKGQSND